MKLIKNEGNLVFWGESGPWLVGLAVIKVHLCNLGDEWMDGVKNGWMD